MADYEDPGWRGAVRGVGWFVLPIAHLWISRRRAAEDGLTSLRRVYLSLVDSLFLFLVAFTFISPWDGGDEGWIPVAVFALGAYCLVAVIRINGRALSTKSPQQLSTSYRATFFICVGMAEAPALFGICGIFIGGSLWIYLVGLPFALAGLATIAPSRANIERKQAKIRSSGSSLSLGESLMVPVESVAPIPGIRMLGRLWAHVVLVAAALVAFGIHAVRPSFDPAVIVLPAVGLFFGVTVIRTAASIARGVAARRRRPQAPPTAGTE